MNKTGKVVAALVAGVAIGAAAGVLFAPGKGSETRRKIKENGKKVAEDVKDKFRKGKEKINDLKESVVQTVKEKVEEFT